MNLNCIIIDDEPYAVELMDMFVRNSTNWNIIGKFYDAVSALEIIKIQKPQLVFLDINMPQLSGIELAELIPSNVQVVFTTAYSDHALASYDYQTIDYLLKPISLKRFLVTVQKIESHFSLQNNSSPSRYPNDDQHFYIKSGKTLHKILHDDILYFEGQKEYVRLVTNNEQLLIYRRLKDLAEQFSMPFIRIHNSYIINTRHLTKVLDNHVYLIGRQIPISEKFREGFMNAIDKFTI